MRVLVTAASKHGATAEIAEAIGDRLRSHGLQVMRLEPDEVGDLEGCDAVVLGGAVYAGHWPEPAKRLAERLAEPLRERPVWLFSSGPVGDPPRPEEDPQEVADLQAAIGARGHRAFAGRIDKGRLGLAERAIVKALRVPAGDFRDWSAIADWADEIAVALEPHEV